ncbi:MAG: hypothetical protein ABS45_16675 [Comamonas sp. SCN 65-56]|nr:MAG: hypothetical protein ABS45_16675 [Comamonas sp. SCN 65-56]
MLAGFIVIQPGIQVKLVIHTAATQLDEGDTQLNEQGHPYAEIFRGLFLVQATRSGQGQGGFLFH